MEHIEKILQKLRKLMNLKESATALGNTGEANAAAAGIARLLMEYNLSEKDIPEQERIENPVVSEEIPYRAKSENGIWYDLLVSICCQYNMCRALYISERNSSTGRMKRNKFEIIGRKKSVDVVLYLISFLSFQFVSLGRKEYPKYRTDCIRNKGITPLTENKFLKSFLVGCAIGLEDKFLKEMPNNEDVKALTLSCEAEINSFLEGTQIGSARWHKPSLEQSVAKQGIQVGRNISINKGIHADVVSEELRLE